MKTYHPYLANTDFEGFTDHISLTWLQQIKLASGRLARWSLRLQEYRFKITHRPGKKNQNADTLSRPCANIDENDTASHSDDEDEIIASVQVNEYINMDSQVQNAQVTNKCSHKQVHCPTESNTDCSFICDDHDNSTQYTVVSFEYPPQNIKPQASAISVDDQGLVQRPEKAPKIDDEPLH